MNEDPWIEAEAFKIWLKFSRAQEMYVANRMAGRPAREPIKRWTESVAWSVKQEFIAEAMATQP